MQFSCCRFRAGVRKIYSAEQEILQDDSRITTHTRYPASLLFDASKKREGDQLMGESFSICTLRKLAGIISYLCTTAGPSCARVQAMISLAISSWCGEEKRGFTLKACPALTPSVEGIELGQCKRFGTHSDVLTNRKAGGARLRFHVIHFCVDLCILKKTWGNTGLSELGSLVYHELVSTRTMWNEMAAIAISKPSSLHVLSPQSSQPKDF